MSLLELHGFHERRGASFVEVSGQEAVDHYGNPLAEHALLRDRAAILDLGFRGRLCVLGADRQRFMNAQVTNDLARLKVGQGCYAALVTAKAKMVSDLNIYVLENELLLDFEPGLTGRIVERLEDFIIADDVEVTDVAPHYGLFSIQGPRAGELIESAGLGLPAAGGWMEFTSLHHQALGEIYLMVRPRTGSAGFDLFVPKGGLTGTVERLAAAAERVGGGFCGWQALETARIEAGLPRFGADMDESNLAPETGLDAIAISYSKGCYIGQEIIARIRTYGQVARTLRGLRLPDDLEALPVGGEKLFKDGKPVGWVTSAVRSPTFRANIALGYVRRENNDPGTELFIQSSKGEQPVTVVALAGMPRW